MPEAKAFIKKTFHYVLDPFLTKALIRKVERLNKYFVLLEVQQTKSRAMSWQAGDKIQIEVGGHRARTFTPFEAETKAGLFKILCFQRENTPAGEWLKNIAVGDACHYLGPSSSLKLSAEDAILLFGDETAIGLAKALQSKHPSVQVFLESSAVVASEQAASLLKIKSMVFSTKADDSHFAKIAEQMLAAATHAKTSFVLAGRARSIQVLRSRLLAGKISASNIKTKVYWADGKTGLD